MHVDEATADLKLFRDNRTYYFCNSTCMATFAEPERELRSLRWKLVVAWPFAMATLLLTSRTTPSAAIFPPGFTMR